jgi:glycosyltransferase involved in cell wall biosynthesis
VPSKLYEAMASGRPVLVSADAAPAELVRDAGTGLASAAGDAAALAAGIERLATDAALARALGRRGAELAARFDRRRLAVEFEALLRRVAAGEPPALSAPRPA